MAFSSLQEKKLESLRANLLEDSQPFFTDEQLVLYLESAHWDVARASQDALLIKAQNDAIKLPSGLEMPNNQPYWLKLSKHFRKNMNKVMKRGD